jgi:preprotein translocase, YajC subunit
MNFFFAQAWAQAAAPTAPSPSAALQPLILLIAIFAVFYFLVMRPQSKRAKEQKKMIEALAKGDEVVTNGGLLGKITEVGENFVILEVAEGVKLNVQKQAVSSLMPKGTFKTT